MASSRTEQALQGWLEAGARAMAAMATDGIRFPTAEQIAAVRGVSADAFKKFWQPRGGLDGFRRALVRYIADIDRFSELPEIKRLMYDLLTAEDLYLALQTFCKEDFRLISTSPSNATIIALLGASTEWHIKRVLHDAYTEVDDYLERLLTEVLAARGLEPIPPFTVSSLATALNQLCDGLTIRHRFDSARANADLYARAVTALAVGATRRIGATETLEERVHEVIVTELSLPA